MTAEAPRRRAGAAADARHLHERLRALGGEAHALLQDPARLTSWCSTTSSTCRRQAAGEDRRRQRRAQRPALDHRSLRQRLSPRAPRHRPSRATRTWCTACAQRFRQGRRASGSRPCAQRSPTTPKLLARGEDASFQNKVHLAMERRRDFATKAKARQRQRPSRSDSCRHPRESVASSADSSDPLRARMSGHRFSIE